MSHLSRTISTRNLTVLIPVSVAIAFAIVASWHFGFQKIEFGDSNDYIAAARSFLNHTPYPRQSELHPMFRPPLFPLFIAAIWKLFPGSVIAVKIAQALLHGATCWIIYLIVYEVLKKRWPAFLGAMVCAINPLLAQLTVDFYTEPLHTFLFALAMFFVVKVLQGSERLYLNAAVAGVAFGLATLCRPSALGVALCLLPVICLLRLKHVQRFRYFAACGILCLSMFVAIAPWTIYNYRTTGEFILVNDGFSYNLWLGSQPVTIRIYVGGFKDAEDNQRFADYVWGTAIKDKVKELEQTDHYSSLKFKEREKVWRREAIKNLTQDYSISAHIMLGKIPTFWTPFLNRFVYGWKIVVIMALFVIGLYLFGIYGAYIFSREPTGRDFVILLAGTFVVVTLIHILAMGIVRYRIPYVDPYLSMLTGVALWSIGTRIFAGKQPLAEAQA